MKVIYNDKIIDIEQPIEIYELLKKYIDNYIIACKYNNEIKSLNYIIEEDCKIDLIDITSRDGRKIYVRGLLYIMGKAFNELYPKALLTVNYQLKNSMFCEIDNINIDKIDIKKVENKMKEIVNNNIPIKKVVMTKQEAKKFYQKEKTLRGRLQVDAKQKDEVSLYYCEDYYNYFYGVMPISTSFATVFELIKYHDGFLLRYPDKNYPEKLEVYKEGSKFLKTLDEYEDIHKALNINTLYKLNKNIKEKKAKEVILIDEALHEKKIAQIADDVSKNKKIKMILISGPSSSGKTTFAKRLGIQLRINGIKPVNISVDNYFVERINNPKDEFGNYDFECIEAIDLELFNEHLKKLLKGEQIEMPTFDFTQGKKIYDGKTLKLAKEEILVIEGIHCLNDKLTEQISKDTKFKIYISALTVLNIDYYNRISTTDTRLIRRIVRDHQFRGYSALHTLQMWNSVNRGELKNIFTFQEDADEMFNTSLVYELAVLKEYAIPLLKEIDNSHPEFSEAKRLYEFLRYFETIPGSYVPKNSLLREFIGGSVFE